MLAVWRVASCSMRVEGQTASTISLVRMGAGPGHGHLVRHVRQVHRAHHVRRVQQVRVHNVPRVKHVHRVQQVQREQVRPGAAHGPVASVRPWTATGSGTRARGECPASCFIIMMHPVGDN